MNWRKTADRTILGVDYANETAFEKGDTDDIITVILHAHKFIKKDTADFALTLKASTKISTLRNIYKFVKTNIKYVADSPGWEKIKSPSQTWKDGYGDCKSMSLLVGSLLLNLGFDYAYRFAGYDKDNVITHIYCVSYIDGEEIVLDTVNVGFNKEEPYVYKKDHKVKGMSTKISYIHGGLKKVKEPLSIPRQRNVNFAGSSGDVALALLDRELEILEKLIPEKKGIWTRGRNAIHASMKEGRYSPGYMYGIIPTELNHIAKAIYSYKNQQNPAISGLIEDLQEYGLADSLLYDTSFNDLYVNSPLKLQYALDLNKALDDEEGGTSVLYEFHPPLNPNYELPQNLHSKIGLQTALTLGSSSLTSLKYNNVLQMSRNGILKSNVRSENGELLFPADQIYYLQQADVPGIGALNAIIGLVVLAVSVALNALGSFLSNKIETEDRMAAYPPILTSGNLTTAGAAKEDFGGWCWDAEAGIYKRGDSAYCTGGTGGTGSKNNILIGSAAVGGALYYYNQ